VKGIIKLNVGGILYVTTTTTLFSQGASYFTGLLSGNFATTKDENGAYFIDRKGEYFNPLLEYMRTGELEIPPGMSREAVLREARFYSLTNLLKYVEEHNAAIEKEQFERRRLRFDGYYLKNTKRKLSESHSNTTKKQRQPQQLQQAQDQDQEQYDDDDDDENCEDEALEFRPDDMLIYCKGRNAIANLIVLNESRPMPQIWKGNASLEVRYAKMMTATIKRGRYWIEGSHLKLMISQTATYLPGVLIGDDSLYLSSDKPELGFIQWKFVPYHK